MVVEETGPPLSDLSREGLHHVGNSTHLIVLGGVSVLTDPWLAEPADRVLAHRVPPSPLPASPDVVLITHRHEDHLDPAALARIDRRATVVCPADCIDLIFPLGFCDVREARPGQVLSDVRGLAVEVVRGRHTVPEVCYRVERGGRALFFGGDTMLTPEITALAADKPTDFVVLPGERSSLLGRRYVMTPEEAVGLARDFCATTAVLSHHEAFVDRGRLVRWIVVVPEPDPSEFPDWFHIPRPGDFIPFPWEVSR